MLNHVHTGIYAFYAPPCLFKGAKSHSCCMLFRAYILLRKMTSEASGRKSKREWSIDPTKWDGCKSGK